MNKERDYDELFQLIRTMSEILSITDETNDKLRELVAKLIDLNIKQLENKISKEDAKVILKKLVDEHFDLEQVCSDIKKYRQKIVQSNENQKQN